MDETPLTYSLPEAAALLGVGERWLAGAAREKRVPSVKLGRAVRFTRLHLEEIIKSHTREANALEPHPWGLTSRAARNQLRRQTGWAPDARRYPPAK